MIFTLNQILLGKSNQNDHTGLEMKLPYGKQDMYTEIS
jgi:hypothetical protein